MKKLMYSFLISGFIAGSIVASVPPVDRAVPPKTKEEELQDSLIILGNKLARAQAAQHLDQQKNDATLATLLGKIEWMKLDHQRMVNDDKETIEGYRTTVKLLVRKGNDDAATIMDQVAKISAQEAKIRRQEAKIKGLKAGLVAAVGVGAILLVANTYYRV